MWVFSKLGFFSIVQARVDGQFQIRARVKDDLDRLLAAINSKERIIETEFADYGYRAIVDRKVMIGAIIAMGQAIDYENFKEAIGDDPVMAPRVFRYGRVWSVMKDLDSDNSDDDPVESYSGGTFFV